MSSLVLVLDMKTRTDQEAADGDFQEEEASEQIMRYGSPRIVEIKRRRAELSIFGMYSGNFFEDLGVDFLNLKELGLDITSVSDGCFIKVDFVAQNLQRTLGPDGIVESKSR